MSTFSAFHERLKELVDNEPPYSWAARMGISKGAFTRIWKEGGMPSAEALLRIKNVAGASLDWLLAGEGMPPDYVLDLNAKRTESNLAFMDGDFEKHEKIEKEIKETEARYVKEHCEKEVFAQVDFDTLEIAITCAELYINKTHKKLTPTKKAKVITVIYKLIQEEEQPPANDKIIDLVELASQEENNDEQRSNEGMVNQN